MLIERLLSLVAPHECLGCLSEGALLCAVCRTSLQSSIHRCYKCQTPGRSFATCTGCRPNAALSSVLSVVKYQGLAKDIVWKLKFGRTRGAASEIAQIISAGLRLPERLSRASGATSRAVIITHAPTATSRVRQRGYDQAALIARGLARDCDVSYSPLLRRTGHAEQIGATRAQRVAQLDGAFYAVHPGRIHGAHIILVDDVVTTGATLESAARVLLSAGARRVDAVVFAQA